MKDRKRNFRRRGERLIRLAYDLEALASEADRDGIGGSDLRWGMDACRRSGEQYIAKAEAR